MGLSSNTILHTTGKTSLLGILESFSFKPQYCFEKIHAKKDDFFNVAIPMVSFSDFPVSELKYRQSYGRYGIGLSKIWARRNMLNPVLYIEKNSQLIQDYLKYYDKVWPEKNIDTNNMLIQVLSYMKNYQGVLKIPKLKIEERNYRFSDEREWRYVPGKSILDTHNIKHWYSGSYYERNKEECNSKLKPIELKFGVDDINYIILSRENEREFFINYINEKHPGLRKSKKNKLISRIISMTRIQYDF